MVAMAIVLAWPSSVWGADADELIREGVALRRKGDDLGALQRFQQAFQTDKSARVVAQIGLAEQALGRWVLAHEHLSQALAAKADPWMQKNRGVIEEALNLVSDHLGKIEILGGSPNAEVRIDGALRGTLPLAGPLLMSIGTVTIDISAPGFFPLQRTAVVRARQTTRESFDPLAPIPNRDRVASAATPTASKLDSPPTSTSEIVPPLGNAASEEATSSDAPPEGASDSSSSRRRSFKWIAWGLGGGALGLGIFGWLQQNSAADDFASGCFKDSMGTVQMLPGSKTMVAQCRDLEDRVDSNFRLEVIGLVGAGVFAGTGLVLWLTEPKPTQPSSVTWSCVPGLTAKTGPWVGCHLHF
jgi:hypothetical protein